MVASRFGRMLLIFTATFAGVLGAAGQAQGKVATAANVCAQVHVSATPKVNAQTAPFETIKNVVTSCATSAETVTLIQRLVGPFSRTASASAMRTWTIVLAPGQTVIKFQHIPYSCCGTFGVTDRVVSRSGRILAHASTSFTFA
jgi:hypothetical protein